MTITLTQPTTATLLDRLYASPGWRHTVTHGLNTDHQATTFRRVEGPFAGYHLTVFGDDDRGAARIADGVERGEMPARGLDIDVIVRAIDAIDAILDESRTGAATLTEVVALRAVAETWYVADIDTRQALRAVCNGRRLDALSGEAVTRLERVTVALASLAMAAATDGFA